jgi:hypothetical protein
MRTDMRVVRAAVVFLTLAIPQIDSQHSRQRSILGFPAHHVAVAVLEALDDRLTTLVGVRNGTRVAQSPWALSILHPSPLPVSLQARQYAVRRPRGGHRPPEREYESRERRS